MMPTRALGRLVLLPLLCSLVGLLLVAPVAPAGAATTVVSVQNYSFTPAIVTVAMGQTVTWEFHSMHTTTSNQRFWDSGMRSSGTYVVAFRDAGTFGYHCSMHSSMTGKVHVAMTRTGSSTNGWRMRWSTRTSTPANRRFDVQYKRVGATIWTWFRKSTARRAGLFDPARNGSYLMRARTRNVGVGASAWSPAMTVRIS
jgi:plastocyanin